MANPKRNGPAAPDAPPAPVTSTGLVARLVAQLGKEAGATVHQGNSVNIRIPGVVSSRCPTLDSAMGRGGWPMARLSILTGMEATGKTTHLLHAIAEVQAAGGVGMFMDAEHKLDMDYAAALGVNTSELIVSKPRYGEEAFGVMASMLTLPGMGTDLPVVIGLDSINSLLPKSEWEAGFEEASMGTLARMYSKHIPKIIGMMSGKRIVMIWISQERMKIGTVTFKEKISGGNSPKFYAALAVELARTEFVKIGERQIGTHIKATVIKNQVAKPFGTAEYNIIWGTGIDYEDALLRRAASLGILNTGGGGWGEVTVPVKGGTERTFKWQGMDGIRGFRTVIMAKTPGVYAWIKRQVYKRFDADAAGGVMKDITPPKTTAKALPPASEEES